MQSMMKKWSSEQDLSPVLDSSGQVAARISISGPTIRMTRSRTAEIADVLKAAALDISTRLGYGTNSPERG
jgi:hypothetical protein